MNFNIDHIGGGIVRRTFKSGEHRLTSGTKLTAEEIKRMPVANRQALIDKKYIDVYPKAPGGGDGVKAERHVVSAGFGKFHVIEGRKLNDVPLSKDQAQALAGVEKTESKRKRQ